MFALRIGTVKNSKNFLRVDGPARVMMAGVAKESTETMASSESDMGRLSFRPPSAGEKLLAQQADRIHYQWNGPQKSVDLPD